MQREAVIEEGQRDRFAVARLDDDLTRKGCAPTDQMGSCPSGQADLLDGRLNAAPDRAIVESGRDACFRLHLVEQPIVAEVDLASGLDDGTIRRRIQAAIEEI